METNNRTLGVYFYILIECKFNVGEAVFRNFVLNLIYDWNITVCMHTD